MKVWQALASATYIGCTGFTLQGCTQFDDRGLFTTPTEGAPDAGGGAGGEGGASAATATSSSTSATSGSTVSTGATSTGAGGNPGSTGSSGSNATGGSAGIGAGGVAAGGAGSGGISGTGGSPNDGGAREGGAGGSSSGGAAGAHFDGGTGGAARDASVPKVCVDLHTAANSAHETAQACMQAGSFTECRLVQDECDCSVGVRAASTQATQRYVMAVQALKDSGCFDACPDAGCPPFAGATCTPGTLSRLQCIAY